MVSGHGYAQHSPCRALRFFAMQLAQASPLPGIQPREEQWFGQVAEGGVGAGDGGVGAGGVGGVGGEGEGEGEGEAVQALTQRWSDPNGALNVPGFESAPVTDT